MSALGVALLVTVAVVLPVSWLLWLAHRSASGKMDEAARRRAAWIESHPRRAAILPGVIWAVGQCLVAAMWAGQRQPLIAIMFVAFGAVGGIGMSGPVWRKVQRERADGDNAP